MKSYWKFLAAGSALAVSTLPGTGAEAGPPEISQLPGPAQDRGAVAKAARGGEIVRDSYIVRFHPTAGAPGQVAVTLAQGQPMNVRHVYANAFHGMTITLPDHAAIQVLDALRRNPRVASIGNDMTIATAAQTISKGVARINAEPALARNAGSGVRVAVVDTGIDFNHADLAGRVNTAVSVDCVTFSGCGVGGQDDGGHGTFVSGIVSAVNNDIGTVGVAPEAELVSVKVLPGSGSGSVSDLIAGLDYLAGLSDNGTQVDVVNLSLAATCSVCTADSTNSTVRSLRDSIRALIERGTTVVAGAGNDGQNADNTIPAAFPETITVSALNVPDGEPGGELFASFSNYGSAIDITAPGQRETSLRLGGGTSTGSGTSFSAPHIAGVSALFIRDRLERNGVRPLPGTVRQALIETGECADGTLHGELGCGVGWPGDPDSYPEPMVRADTILNFNLPREDVAVTGLSVSGPVDIGSTHPVEVGVANLGTESATFDVGLSEEGDPVDDAETVTLTAGDSTVVTFAWSPAVAGERTLTATAEGLEGDVDLSNNTRSTTITVIDLIHDVAVASVSAPEEAETGEMVEIAVAVDNLGTADDTLEVNLTGASSGSGAFAIGEPQEMTLTAGSSADLTFIWNTGEAAAGDYTLTAQAVLLSAEDEDPSNNAASTALSLNAVEEEPEPDPEPEIVHDMAIGSITAPANAEIGEAVEVAVEVANLGTVEDSVEVSVRNTDPSGSEGPIANPQTLTLLAGANTTVVFIWDTAGETGGEHTLTANAALLNATDSDSSNTTASTAILMEEPEPEEPAQSQPVIAISQPIDGAELPAGESVRVTTALGEGIDPSSIRDVQFRFDDSMRFGGRDRRHPFEFTISGRAMTAGTHTITIRARTDFGDIEDTVTVQAVGSAASGTADSGRSHGRAGGAFGG